LSLILGLPVAWYLFLQMFGENKFELSAVGKINVNCQCEASSIYILDTGIIFDENLQYKRLLIEGTDQNIVTDLSEGMKLCFDSLGVYPLILTGPDNSIMGYYQLTIDDVDRVLVEADLLKYLKTNERE
jgi:hypothetical protein